MEATVKRSEIISQLREYRSELTDMNVSSLAVFGSVARNEATATSDVDLLVEFSTPVGFFEFYAVKERLESILGASVDLVTLQGLKPRIRDRILSEAISAT